MSDSARSVPLDSSVVGAARTPRTVAISGATGLVGTALAAALRQRGDQVVPITRHPSTAAGDALQWDPAKGILNPQGLSSIDAVIHLAGENIAAGRWTDQQKSRIRDSRVLGTRSLVKSLVKAEHGPKSLICASAIGFYGDRGDEVLTEASAAGSGFLPDVCRQWEDEARGAETSGLRVVTVRTGIVLSPKGGALAKMLLPFKLGVGGVIGPGTQYWSWIGLNDLVRVFIHCLDDASLHGPVNAVSPEPLTNREFTKAVGRVLHRPTIFPMPAFAARLALGEMADALLLASARVLPERLALAGFRFAQPTLAGCLENELSQSGA